MPEHVTVGVDLGGTRVRVVAHAKPRNRLHQLEAPAPALAELPAFLRRLWLRWGLSRNYVDALVVGARGVWTVGEKRFQERRLGALARQVTVIPDAEAAFLGALGEGPGLLVLSGTGSIVLGRNVRGRWARAGGLGPLMGDEGSAFWIGREWLRANVHARKLARVRMLARSADAIKRIAALAPGVLRKAKAGHRDARAIVGAAQEHLASLARQVARELRLPRPVPLSWAGTLMGNGAFRRGVWRASRREGIAVRVVPPAQPPVSAAHALAARLARDAEP